VIFILSMIARPNSGSRSRLARRTLGPNLPLQHAADHLVGVPIMTWLEPISLTVRNSGYILAKMPFKIVLAPEAVEDFKSLRANVRADIPTALETHLRHQPAKVSRSRIKRLRGLRQPQYRLRVGDIRIFYDVTGTTVHVLAIVTKLEADSWLAQFGNPE